MATVVCIGLLANQMKVCVVPFRLSVVEFKNAHAILDLLINVLAINENLDLIISSSHHLLILSQQLKNTLVALFICDLSPEDRWVAL